MSNHPNRSKFKTPAARPPPEAIAAYRRSLRKTQREAAEVIYATENAWKAWEAGVRPMHPAHWELFRLKTLDAQVLKALNLRVDDDILYPEEWRANPPAVVSGAVIVDGVSYSVPKTGFLRGINRTRKTAIVD